MTSMGEVSVWLLHETPETDPETYRDKDLSKDLGKDLNKDLDKALNKDLDEDLNKDLDEDLNKDIDEDLNNDLEAGFQEEAKDTAEEPRVTATIRRASRVAGFALPYFAALLPAAYLAYLLPSSPLPLGVWAQDWPWSTLLIWVAAIVSGYAFVACVTEKRENPFKSRFGGYQCFFKIVATSPFVYLCGPVRALLSSAHSDHMRAFLGNTTFLAAFFVGLQFTYLDSILLFRRAGDKFGTPSLWKTYTRAELALMFPTLIGVMGVLSWHFYLIRVNSLVIWYSALYCIVSLALIVPSLIRRKTHYLHVHHYVIFGLLIPFFSFPNAVSLVCLGVASGVYVEGISRWGMARLWYEGTQRQYS